MATYYNDTDPYVCAWVRNLIREELVPDGDVDDRSITDVRADDLRGYASAHFFCGILGWPLAGRLAGLPDDFEWWTGSCPCQPYSVAGKGKGADDARDLWPVWFNLIRECRPSVVFGEQVSAAITHGWLDRSFADLEGQGYACGAAVLPACSVGAPHKRDRLWFVGDVVHPASIGRGEGRPQYEFRSGRPSVAGASGGSAFAGNADASRSSQRDGEPGDARQERATVERASGRSPWDDAEWITGADGKARRVKSGIRLLANGVPNRVGRLRAYGNAIVPQVAAEFIGAYLDIA